MNACPFSGSDERRLIMNFTPWSGHTIQYTLSVSYSILIITESINSIIISNSIPNTILCTQSISYCYFDDEGRRSISIVVVHMLILDRTSWLVFMDWHILHYNLVNQPNQLQMWSLTYNFLDLIEEKSIWFHLYWMRYLIVHQE